MLQQFPSQQTNNNSKHRVDPDKIYPKRLGTYQGGNALVLEYYNLVLDKFRKHVIPLDRGKSIKQNIDEIYKNPKHFVLLKKVQPKYVEGVMRGESFLSQISSLPNSITQNNNNRSQQSSSYLNNNNSNSPYDMSSQQQSYYHYQNSSQSSHHNQQYTDQTINNNNNSFSEIIRNEPSSSQPLSQQAKEKIEQVEDYYDEDFEELEISQSMGKKSANKSGVTNTNTDNLKHQGQPKSSINSQQQKTTQQPQQKQQKKQKKSKKSKESKKKQKKKKQSEPQQDQFEFDFLDDDDNAPKSTTNKKKQSSKQKQKSKKKEKSKQKQKSKKQTPKVQQKLKPQIQQTIEEDFDFDL